jgi:hypothetical protein
VCNVHALEEWGLFLWNLGGDGEGRAQPHLPQSEAGIFPTQHLLSPSSSAFDFISWQLGSHVDG